MFITQLKQKKIVKRILLFTFIIRRKKCILKRPYIEGINLPRRFERHYNVISYKGLLRHSPLPYNNQYTRLFKKCNS